MLKEMAAEPQKHKDRLDKDGSEAVKTVRWCQL